MVDILSPAIVAQGPVAPALAITGTLSNAETHYPLPGLLVRAFYQAPPEHVGDKSPPRQLLGRAISDAAGQFALTWDASPAVAQLLCLLARCGEAEYSLTVALSEHTPVLLTTPPSPAGKTTISRALLISLPSKRLTHAEWGELGERLAATGVATVSALVEQISRPAGTGLVARDWPLPKRQQAIAEMERAFLDPRGTLAALAPLPSWQALGQPGALDAYRASLGAEAETAAVAEALRTASLKLSAFNGLSDVNWQIDPKLFHRDPGAAITADQDRHFGAEPIATQRPPPFFVFTPEQGYRDYLRAQWTNDITLVSPNQPLELTLAQADQQLRNRFHQDFATTKAGRVTANEVLIPILTEILTAAPGGTFGFGVAATAIPARPAGMPARVYLDMLIGLTKLSATELGLRYRVDFTRPDSATSSPVWENIYTLQGFFRDSFQSVPDPVNTAPDVLGQPIIPDMMALQAPFFLEYDEWLLLQEPVSFENYVQPRLVFVMDVSAEVRKNLVTWAAMSGPLQATLQFILAALPAYDTLVKAYQCIDDLEYKQGLDALDAVENLLEPLLNNPLVSTVDVLKKFGERRATKVGSLADLHALMVTWKYGWTADVYSAAIAAQDLDKLICALVYFKVFCLPTVRAEAQLALGDYVPAVRRLGRAAGLIVGAGAMDFRRAWRPPDAWEEFRVSAPLYLAGDLPYTARSGNFSSFVYDDINDQGIDYSTDTKFADLLAPAPNALHATERAFYRLEMGLAMLEWADTLYRTDQAASIARARELYKGVTFLHGARPRIDPEWTPKSLAGSFLMNASNPATLSQFWRAEIGFTQINAGLNWFGYADDMVPQLRYTTLKPAADGFAAEAAAAERDFLIAMTRIEEATVDAMKNSAMLNRSRLLSEVAKQQAGIAADQVVQANALIAQVNAQIAKAQKDADDHDSFFGQLGDYLGGMASIAKGGGEIISTSKTFGVAGGASSAEADSTVAMSGAAAGMSGYAAFFIASYITMSSMADAANERQQTLSLLGASNLPAAQAQFDIANRSATIAGLQQSVAQSDSDLAANLLAFGQDRFLSSEFWTRMARLFQRSLHAYLDLAARTGWLAERALAYEQNRTLGIMGFDYYPAAAQGAGGRRTAPA